MGWKPIQIWGSGWPPTPPTKVLLIFQLTPNLNSHHELTDPRVVLWKIVGPLIQYGQEV